MKVNNEANKNIKSIRECVDFKYDSSINENSQIFYLLNSIKDKNPTIVSDLFFKSASENFDKIIKLLSQVDYLEDSGYFIRCYKGNSSADAYNIKIINGVVEHFSCACFFNGIIERYTIQNKSEKSFYNPSWIDVILKNNSLTIDQWNDSFLNNVLGIILFRKYAEVEIKTLKPKERSFKFNSKYTNETNYEIDILDCKWFTELINSNSFKVSGHLRLQPYKTQKKIIWINEFEKKGYKSKAKI